MKILTIVESLGIGGTERVAQNFAIAYKRKGHDSRVLIIKSGGVREKFLQQENITIFDASIERSQVFDAVNTWQAEIIHIHRPGYANYLNDIIPLIKSHNTKVVETNIFARPDYSNTAYLIDLHLLLTKWCLWKWQNWTKGLNQIGTVIPNPIDTELFKSSLATNELLKKKLGLPKDAFILGRVGQKIGVKWHPMIFELLERLIISNDIPNAYLLLIGAPTEIKNALYRFPKYIKERVKFIEYVDNDQDLNNLYNLMDVFVHAASIGESFGMVIAEAQMNRVPVVTLSTPLKDNSQVELVKNNITGYVVNNLNSCHRAIVKLFLNRHLREKFGNNGFENISKNYSSSFVTDRILNLFRILLASNDVEVNRKLLENNGYIVNVSEKEINDLHKNFFGSPHKKIIHVKSKILHSKLFYQTYLKVKSLFKF